ncbi:MAG: hypothetical protein L0220_16720, partial [Acidobacteria bacterium]|nr:hypothetical protein [Acidobacteriota bacterium]
PALARPYYFSESGSPGAETFSRSHCRIRYYSLRTPGLLSQQANEVVAQATRKVPHPVKEPQ